MANLILCEFTSYLFIMHKKTMCEFTC